MCTVTHQPDLPGTEGFPGFRTFNVKTGRVLGKWTHGCHPVSVSFPVCAWSPEEPWHPEDSRASGFTAPGVRAWGSVMGQ